MKEQRNSTQLLPLWDEAPSTRSNDELAAAAVRLHAMWRAGLLGGEQMPEDVHPPLPADSDELALYFTLGMTLNYQRNSYALWRACTAAYEDPQTRWVFDASAAAVAEPSRLSEALTRHRVALQPNRHPQIWQQNARGLVSHASGSVKSLFAGVQYDLGAVKGILADQKKSFPYLSGPKISNYWLYVISTYMDWPTTNRASLTVAPDTHVISASIRLGLVADSPNPSVLTEAVAQGWSKVLENTGLLPIDIHTPLWLWSRAGFPNLD